jgi:hypothetical protein
MADGERVSPALAHLPPALKPLRSAAPADFDRIRTEFPGISAERFKRPRRRYFSLRSAFRVTDVNSPLQALERVPVGAEQIFEKANLVCGHHTLHTFPITANTAARH